MSLIFAGAIVLSGLARYMRTPKLEEVDLSEMTFQIRYFYNNLTVKDDNERVHYKGIGNGQRKSTMITFYDRNKFIALVHYDIKGKVSCFKIKESITNKLNVCKLILDTIGLNITIYGNDSCPMCTCIMAGRHIKKKLLDDIYMYKNL